MLLLPDTAET
jgi:hypothetical protein